MNFIWEKRKIEVGAEELCGGEASEVKEFSHGKARK